MQTVCIIKMFPGIVSLVVHLAIIIVQATCLRVFFLTSNLVTIFQMSATMISTIVFLFVIPWKVVVAHKKNSQSMRNLPQGEDRKGTTASIVIRHDGLEHY